MEPCYSLINTIIFIVIYLRRQQPRLRGETAAVGQRRGNVVNRLVWFRLVVVDGVESSRSGVGGSSVRPRKIYRSAIVGWFHGVELKLMPCSIVGFKFDGWFGVELVWLIRVEEIEGGWVQFERRSLVVVAVLFRWQLVQILFSS
ncbi:hypothetical protein Droror1_Dr00015385 [Drosera rotundifolia]